jgi:ComF family protein
MKGKRSWAPFPTPARARAVSPALAAIGRVAGGLRRDLEEFVLPSRCPGCGIAADPARLLCEPCRARIPRLSFSLCARCLVRGREAAACVVHPLQTVWAAWVYDERAAIVIQTLKYGERPRLAETLGEELARAIPSASDADLVVEVPLHPARQRERGYNQAALLADALSATIGVPRLPAALERVRATRPQARLDARARRENVDGAFRARRPDWLSGRTVMVVDDVMTTGATLEACMEVLASAGARPLGVALAWAQ